ncbi:sulfotransferase [Spirillospora sp. CA-294931]|uniref:sulfotransferase n=1 Tax=Spirillospora sp. CA-294931 TaxID=3240042 RepID=UPI003D8A5F0F
MKILYITGWCRTGSTLLGNLLAEPEGVAHVGELAYLWNNGVLRDGTNSTCGCGKDLRDCPVWSGTLTGEAAARDQVRRHDLHLRTRHTRARLAEARQRKPKSPQVVRTLRHKADLYAKIARILDADTLIDSSKFPAEAAALCGLPDLDVRVLHLVRDPRATAHSWRRAKDYIPPMSVTRSTAYWTAFNLASDRIGIAFPDRYLRVRYEDFTAHPARTLATISAWAELPAAPAITPEGTATLGENHTVTGNPDRLRRGEIRIRLDDAWTRDLPPKEATISTALALPLLAKYGYPLTLPR